MSEIATERVFTEDANGITRLIAAPGDVVPAAAVTPGVVPTPPGAPHVVPFDGYDTLAEAEVLAKLAELDAETLDLVRAYEQAHLSRGSITRYGLTSSVVDVPPEGPAPAPQPASTHYDDQTVDELYAEAERRELEVDGTGADGKVLKKDLVAALKADDE